MRKALALAAASVGIAGEVTAIAVSTAGSRRWNETALAAVLVAYAVVGVLILWHRPGNPVGRIAVATVAVWGPANALVAASGNTLRTDPASQPAALGMSLGAALAGLPWLVLVLVLPLVFPDGSGPPTRVRRVAWRVVTITLASFSLVAFLSPTLTRIEFDEIDNPIGLPHELAPVMDALAGLNILLGMASLGLAIACLVQRYRRGGALDRQQTLIFGLAFLPPILAFAASFADAAGPWLFGLSTLPLPVAIGVAVLQRRLFDLPLALNRAITYAGLCVVIALLYALVIGGVGAMLQQEDAAWLPWVAAGVVAVAFAPLRAALQNAANRVTYGQWSQPREVLARTGRRLADAGELDTLLATLVDELTVGLELGHVDITDKQGRVLASSGVESGETDGAPLWAYGEVVGRLRWTRRTLRDSDRELLADLARQLGGVVHTYALVRSLREAQERLVLAREEERRRLRRDLHDGLGPTLAALSLQVDTVRNRLGAGTRDDEVDDALLHLRGGIQATVLDVRRIVEGLRPPALDDLGLVEALHQLVEGSVVPAAVDAVALPRLPAAVEVAAYRVVQEALTNAVRHAQAEHVEVRVELCDGRLLVTVCDDGIGEVVPRTEGVGMSSMRERAEEIGGTFEVLPVAGRGTRVCVALPLETRAGHAS